MHATNKVVLADITVGFYTSPLDGCVYCSVCLQTRGQNENFILKYNNLTLNIDQTMKELLLCIIITGEGTIFL